MFARKCKTCDTCDTCNTCAPAPTHCDTCNTCKEPKASFFSRFHRQKGCDVCDTCGGCGAIATPAPQIAAPAGPSITPVTPGMIPPAEPIKKPMEGDPKPMPEKKTLLMPPALELQPTQSKVIETETKHPFELSRRYQTRVERATDYSWITGQLFFVHADGGLWVLRYAPVGQEDPNGGGVILARDHPMDSYREGDLVTVRGEILKERASMYLGAPLYRASAIELVDRGR